MYIEHMDDISILEKYLKKLTFEQVGAIDALICAWKGQGEVSLAGGVKVERISGRLSLSR